MRRNPSVIITGSVVALALTFATALPADAASPRHFANCTALAKLYHHGVAKAGVKYNLVHSKGKVVKRALPRGTTFSTPLYNANKRLDADRDGIACER